MSPFTYLHTQVFKKHFTKNLDEILLCEKKRVIMNNDKYKMKSRLLQAFIKEIKYNNRNPNDNRVLQFLNELHTNPERSLSPGHKLYRCRIVNKDSELGSEENFWGYNLKNSFVPPYEKTSDMRANYKYIPYLYCANHPYTSIVEVRPRLGSRVSIATLQVKEKITLLDFTLHKLSNKISESKINLFTDLSYLFSKPIEFEDDTLDYIPTQYIAEYAKNLGYDGITFESSLTPELSDIDGSSIDTDRYNVVVFNYEKCIPVRSNLFEVFGQYTECRQIDDDKQKMYVDMPFSEMFEKDLNLK